MIRDYNYVIFNDLVDLGIIEKNQNKEYELSNDKK